MRPVSHAPNFRWLSG